MTHSLHSALIRSQTARENKSTRHISWPTLNNLECKNETATMSSWVGGFFFFSLYSLFLHTNWFNWTGLKPFNMIQVLCWKMRSLLSKEEKEIQHKNWKISHLLETVTYTTTSFSHEISASTDMYCSCRE